MLELRGGTKMLVKCLLLICVFHCVFGVDKNEMAHLQEVNAKCRKEHRLQEDEVSHLNKTRHLETNDERIKCFIKCLLTSLNLMNEKGDLTLETPLEVTSEKKQKIIKHFPACKNVTGPNPCDKALNFQNCMWKEIDKEEKTSN